MHTSHGNKIMQNCRTLGIILKSLIAVAGISAVSAHAMNLTVSEPDDKGSFYISWTDAKGGTGFADVVVEEKIDGEYKTIYSYNNGPSANTYRITDKTPGTYTYRITECIDTDCNKPLEKSVVVPAP